MNEEILNELDTIKDLLLIIITLLGVIVLGYIVKFIAKLIREWTTNRERAFIHIASGLYEKGSYEELSEYCEDRMKNWSGSPYPIYWLARAQFKLGELASAKELFETALDMEPEWEASIRPHLEKLQNN